MQDENKDSNEAKLNTTQMESDSENKSPNPIELRNVWPWITCNN